MIARLSNTNFNPITQISTFWHKSLWIGQESSFTFNYLHYSTSFFKTAHIFFSMHVLNLCVQIIILSTWQDHTTIIFITNIWYLITYLYCWIAIWLCIKYMYYLIVKIIFLIFNGFFVKFTPKLQYIYLLILTFPL